MIRARSALLTLGLLLVPGMSQATDFAEGQVWKYKTRPGEEGSTFQVNRVEEDSKLGPVFHISVSGLHVRVPQAKGGFVSDLSHLPVSRETLDASVTSLSGEPPRKVAFEGGYTEWKNAKGGVFTIPISEIVTVVEKTVSGETQ